eukprot:TRINITY_DN1290_c0_g1_i1.p1 TRINITY_DN1290_c0_g1~~TRINITY_DN1290_c0_g1_i1.p1  ORF type:complete len:902 (+),score=262.89 TRINITY_DN1290_c0_g1_i1:551-3256(+)
MAGLSEKELELHLINAGKRLEPLPSSKEELVNALTEVEKYLSMVEQSPSASIESAVRPTMNALVEPPLLRHSDKDVRLLVVACVSEITRITAPEAPYNDDTMKEVFQLIVGSFEGLKEMHSKSFIRRMTILETVAKVRSCVVMLDLECDDLIIEMFEHFFATASPKHPENVRLSMQLIMQLVLDESEDISQQLLLVLLSNLRREKRESSPAAHKLAVLVVKACAEKLKPYLASEISAEGLSPTDVRKEYHEIVYEICWQGRPVPPLTSVKESQGGGHDIPDPALDNDLAPNSERANSSVVGKVCADEVNATASEGKEHLDDRSKLTGDKPEPQVSPADHKEVERGQQIKDPGIEAVHDTAHEGPVKSNKGRRNSQPYKPTPSVKTEAEKAGDSKATEKEKRSGGSKNRRKSRKIDSEANRATEEKLGGAERKRGQPARESKDSVSQPLLPKEPSDTAVQDGILNMQPTESALSQGAESKAVSPSVSTRDQVGTTSPSQSNKEPEGRPLGTPLKTMTEGMGLGQAIVAETSSPAQVDREETLVSENTSKIKDEVPVTETPRSKRGRPKGLAKSEIKEETAVNNSDASFLEKDSEDTDKPEATPSKSKRMRKQLEPERASDGSLSRRPRRRVDSDVTKALDKRLSKNQDPREADASKETPVVGTVPKENIERSKRTPRSSVKASAEAEKTSANASAENVKLIGRKVKVWWPKDKQFYEGVVDSYDEKTKKHKILYDDGDVEILKLNRQRWHFVEDNTPEKSSAAVTPKSATDKETKKRSSKGESLQLKDVEAASTKRGSNPSRRKKSKPQSDEKVNGNGTTGKNPAITSDKGDAGVVEESKLSLESNEQSGTKKRKRSNPSSARANGSARRSRGSRDKGNAEHDKVGNTSGGVERNSDDEPLV